MPFRESLAAYSGNRASADPDVPMVCVPMFGDGEKFLEPRIAQRRQLLSGYAAILIPILT